MEEIKKEVNEKSIYDLYDELCTICYINLFSKAMSENAINLKEFNIKDENHLFVFEIANLVSLNCKYPIHIDAKFIDRFRLYWRKRKATKFFKKMKNSKIDRTVNDLLEHMYINCKLTDDNIFTKIYEAYYKKGSKK